MIQEGYSNLRQEQSQVVTSFVGGNDVFPILPTGFGKSLWNAILPCVLVHILSKYPVLVAAFPTRCISGIREQRGAL